MQSAGEKHYKPEQAHLWPDTDMSCGAEGEGVTPAGRDRPVEDGSTTSLLSTRTHQQCKWLPASHTQAAESTLQQILAFRQVT